MPFGLAQCFPVRYSMECSVAYLTRQSECTWTTLICWFSISVEEHEKNTSEVSGRLRRHRLYTNRGKWEFYRESVLFLGFVLCRERLAPDPQKTEASMH